MLQSTIFVAGVALIFVGMWSIRKANSPEIDGIDRDAAFMGYALAGLTLPSVGGLIIFLAAWIGLQA